MAYKALYRTYRPMDFESMSGQKHIITTLKNAIKTNKIAHAYIFSGPRGTGKTSTAKILAKAVNCLTEGENKPCNECENCKAINDNTFPDIVEIDAASNNGVDEVRELIEKVKYAPIKGKYKVYIIDEVHMMTPGAFNALLKTLEEPPAHVIFILATTDIHRVLPTILSRCQRFDFNKLSYDDIKEKVEYILKQENVIAEDGVTSLIAELADGGMRDALSELDQLISYAGNEIKLQHIYDMYGMMSAADMIQYLILISLAKTSEVFELIEQYIEKGIDVRRLTYDLMVCLKDAIIYSSTSDASILEKLNEEQAKEVLKYYSKEKAIAVVDCLNETLTNYRQSSNYRLFFEIGSLKAIEKINANAKAPKVQETVVKQEEVKPKVEEKVVEQVKQEEVKPQVAKQETVEQKPATNNVVFNNLPVNSIIKKVYLKPESSERIEYSIDDYVNIVAHGDKRFKLELIDQWKQINEYLNYDQTKYIAQLLAEAKIGAANKDFCVLVYDHRIVSSRAQEKNNLILIRQFLKELFNYDFEIYVLDHSLFVDVTHTYMQLIQAHKQIELRDLPKLEVDKPIELPTIEETKPETNETIEIGKSVFGDLLKIKEK